jgi:hypothetical protein
LMRVIDAPLIEMPVMDTPVIDTLDTAQID